MSSVCLAALVNLNLDDWEYRAEGNQNLVLSIPKKGEVVRLLKQEVELMSKSEPQATLQFLFLCNRYVEEIMRVVIGSEFVSKSELIQINNIEENIEQIEKFRPVSRKNKKLPSPCFGFRTLDCVTISNDVTDSFGCVIGVEIKPKMGFIPNSPHIPEHQKLKTRICKYQLMQRRKLSDGRIKEISDYCPIHLFSGDEEKMVYAIKCLLRNCQNNLRIFKDGKLVCVQDGLTALFSGNLSDDCEDKFCRLLVQALLKIKPGNESEIQECHLPQSCICDNKLPNCTVTNGGLPKNCVLGRILSAQKRDSIDVEGVAPIYGYLSKNVHEITTEMFHGLDSLENLEPDIQEKTKIVQDFLIAATAKDCSIMITIKEVNRRSVGKFLNLDDRLFAFETHVLDLDAKPHERIIKYLQEERKLVKNYLSSG